jgi:phosphoribosylanthranilate isomerase
MIDLNVAVEAGADAIGVICDRDRQTRNTVDLHRAKWFVRNTPKAVTSVLVPRLTDVESLSWVATDIKPDRIQLGEKEDPQLARALYSLDSSDRPEIAQVIHIDETTTAEAINPFLDYVDCIHLDTKSKERPGGTGQTHDWEISAVIARAAREAGKLVILAGGLTPENVGRAIAVVQPDGVDVETGIKNEYGAHDPAKVEQFVSAARAAFNNAEVKG